MSRNAFLKYFLRPFSWKHTLLVRLENWLLLNGGLIPISLLKSDDNQILQQWCGRKVFHNPYLFCPFCDVRRNGLWWSCSWSRSSTRTGTPRASGNWWPRGSTRRRQPPTTTTTTNTTRRPRCAPSPSVSFILGPLSFFLFLVLSLCSVLLLRQENSKGELKVDRVLRRTSHLCTWFDFQRPRVHSVEQKSN